MARQYGYTITIKGFLPADRKSAENTHRATALILAAQKDPAKRSELADALTNVSVDVRSTSIPGAIPMTQLSDILTAVCRYYRIPERDIISPIRFRERVTVRRVYFYLARTVGHASYPAIAKSVGMNHSTVHEGVWIMADRIERDGIDIAGIMAGAKPTGVPAEWVSSRAR